ncbi:MAG TPA: gliding motility-associated C-terminal domain-containing protein [Bacteroidia bacterium]|nr:gliding motility-associated C-terminal domain-containing protein [Bacteroidia bacterium]HNT81094.1 gliding motility-associated C-terminal domain-containing protein [Bacteroidia bacterium]
MKRICLIGLLHLLLSLNFQAYATHNRAGEITVSQIGTLSFEATITTYVKTSSQIPRPVLGLNWGDGTLDSIPQISSVSVAADITKNVYKGTHTYSGFSSFTLSFEDPNRNGGVINIPNSVNVPFYVETKITVSPFVGANSSPILLQAPIDNALVNQLFIHNPNAFDPDGDSLSYELIFCRGEQGNFIPGYTYPNASSSFSLDSISGDLIWDTPIACGEYNVAFLVKEWRNGINIGFVTRDMQIDVICNGTNNPPNIATINDTCIEANTSLVLFVTATDPDFETITLTGTGGPLFLNDGTAFFPQPIIAPGTVTGVFTWNTNCTHVRKSPYQMTFKATDNNSIVNLSDLQTIRITVVAPSPKNPTAAPFGNSINLNWDQSICQNAIGYKIYRRAGTYGFVPANCETGVPSYTGYQLIADVAGVTNNFYTDNNMGSGLSVGVQYCYMVIAYFADGSESYASVEFCAELKRDLPVITNVSVNQTHTSNGSVYVAWSWPKELDSVQVPGPYMYRIHRSTGIGSNNFILIDSLFSLFDTTYTDTFLNTESQGYEYRIELMNLTPGNVFSAGSSKPASSIFISALPSDQKITLSWNEMVPWTNALYEIYRFDGATFQLIDTSYAKTYTDSSLINGISYCYKIQSAGDYSASGFVSPILNWSQEVCSTPIDNVPPCSPSLAVNVNCSNRQNELIWNNPNNSCANDVAAYNIYFSSGNSTDFSLIATLSTASDTTFIHSNLSTLVGCYKITAIDSAGNESTNPLVVCVDSCNQYNLPNVFTPNGDGVNDLFHPCDESTDLSLQIDCPPYRNVKDIDIKIFNRWGQIVFSTDDRDINWNGKINNNGSDCPDGVYHYICIVNEIFLDGIKPRTITGFIHLIRNGK